MHCLQSHWSIKHASLTWRADSGSRDSSLQLVTCSALCAQPVNLTYVASTNSSSPGVQSPEAVPHPYQGAHPGVPQLMSTKGLAQPHDQSKGRLRGNRKVEPTLNLSNRLGRVQSW
jgi:hypothetical protein